MLGVAFVIGKQFPSLGALLLIGGSFKSVSYFIGWRIYHSLPFEDLNEPTEVGEALSGFFDYVSILAVFVTLISLGVYNGIN